MKRFLLSLLVCLGAICAQAGSSTPYVVEASSLNVRQKPSTDAAVIGKLSQGQVVEVMSISNGWAYIIYHKSFGYVSAKYLKKKYGAGSSSTSSSAKSTSSTSKSSSSASNGFPYSDGMGPRYGGWTETGLIFAPYTVGFNLDLVNGCYIRDYIFVGGGIGFRGAFSPGYGGMLTVPIYAQARGVLRVNHFVAPYLDFSIGGFVGWATGWEGMGGAVGYVYSRVAPGIRLGKHFHLSLGYEYCGYNAGVLAVGADW